jgi:hypothetical protein
VKPSTHTLVATFTALTLALAAGTADAHRRGGGYWGPGPFWGGVGIGVGIGLGSYYYRPYYPDYVIVEPPPVVYREAQPVPPREPVAKAAPDPIFYPRDGQNAARVEADRVECNRWATTQPSAMADASVFHRATLACMEGRGYVVK